MLKNDVLNILEQQKGCHVSGQAIADMLSVSRNAVSKAVAALRSDGYAITASTRCGYMLAADCDILSREGIGKYLTAKNFNITVLDSVDSTNSLLKRMAADGAAENTVVVARSQTAGRGRMGRSFFSPADCGVYISMLIRPQLSAEDALRITTSAAVAVARALRKLGVNARIKWVNDLYVGGKKVCGILTEAALNLECGSVDYAVLGIGANVSVCDGGYPDEISHIAAPAFSTPPTDAKNKLAANILDELAAMHGRWLSSEILDEYRALSMLTGKRVQVLRGGDSYSATVVGIDDRAGLIVADDDGREQVLSSGEVSVRAKDE